MKIMLIFLVAFMILAGCREHSAMVIALNKTTAPIRDIECKIRISTEVEPFIKVVPVAAPGKAVWELVWKPFITGLGGFGEELPTLVNIREIGGSWSDSKEERLSDGDVLRIDILDSGFTLYW
jgi:hypothetical protein